MRICPALFTVPLRVLALTVWIVPVALLLTVPPVTELLGRLRMPVPITFTAPFPVMVALVRVSVLPVPAEIVPALGTVLVFRIRNPPLVASRVPPGRLLAVRPVKFRVLPLE